MTKCRGKRKHGAAQREMIYDFGLCGGRERGVWIDKLSWGLEVEVVVVVVCYKVTSRVVLPR